MSQQTEQLFSAFGEELEKIAISKTRQKKRPYRVSTLLGKESEGSGGWTGRNKQVYSINTLNGDNLDESH